MGIMPPEETLVLGKLVDLGPISIADLASDMSYSLEEMKLYLEALLKKGLILYRDEDNEIIDIVRITD